MTNKQTTIDPVRWAQIENLPLPNSMGDLKDGLCATARINYAVTGKITDDLLCLPVTIHDYLLSFNDELPRLKRGTLGSLAIAQRALAADTSPEAEERRGFICSHYAACILIPKYLKFYGYHEEAEALLRLPRIIDGETLQAAREMLVRVYEQIKHMAPDNAELFYEAFMSAIGALDFQKDQITIDWRGGEEQASARFSYLGVSEATILTASELYFESENAGIESDVWDLMYRLLDELLDVNR